MKLIQTSSDDFINIIKKTKLKKIFFNISLKYFKKDESFKFEIFQSENFM